MTHECRISANAVENWLHRYRSAWLDDTSTQCFKASVIIRVDVSKNEGRTDHRKSPRDAFGAVVPEKLTTGFCPLLSSPMDLHPQDQHQKDFLSTFFSQDSSNQTIEGHQQSISMFPFTPASGTSAHHNPIGMQQAQQHNLNPQINMDILMQMHGIDNPPVSPQPSYNPQSLLEQQFKLTQLQQLQQLQNQIFQQQVNCQFHYFSFHVTVTLR